MNKFQMDPVAGTSSSTTPQASNEEASPPNPLENSVVIDRICSFLRGKDLLECRLVNKQWNSSSIRILRNLTPYYHISLSGREIGDYLKFLDSRDEEIEWYANDIKYMLSLLDSFRWREPTNMKEELQNAQRLVQKFGPDCVQTVILYLYLSRLVGGRQDSSPETLLAICVSIERIVRNTTLGLLIGIRLPGGPGQTNMTMEHLVRGVTRILNSAKAIKYLYLRIAPGMSLSPSPVDTEKILKVFHQVQDRVLSTIERLDITVGSRDCYRILREVRFAGLGRLRLRLEFEEQHNYANDWEVIRRFLNESCPLLTHCTFDLVRVTEDDFQASMVAQNINMASMFPRIEFEYIYTYDEELIWEMEMDGRDFDGQGESSE
jgi:hypothetical protein